MDGLPLHLTMDEFSRCADRVVGGATDYLTRLDDLPVRPRSSGPDTVRLFGGSMPEHGLGEQAFDDLLEVAEHSRAGNARFFGYVMGSGEPVAALGDLFASVINQNATSWRSAPAATVIERTVVRWLGEALGCPGFRGVLTSGGSLANLMGLAAARETRSPANRSGTAGTRRVVYASSEAHMSIGRATALLGFGLDNFRSLPCTDDLTLSPDALRRAIAEDRARGLLPVAVVATAGSVATGAIDPIAEIVEVAREEDLWVHVDGAYGVPAALAEPERFAGLAETDSFSLDAHKWLYQPLDCSLVMFRDPAAAHRAFAMTPDYIASSSTDAVEGDVFFEETLELSRRVRGLKLWLSLRYHGLTAFRAAIAENLRQAQLLADLVDRSPGLERLAEVPLSVVCFRWTGGDPADADAANARLLDRVNRRGRVFLSNATVHGHYALRACITNHRTRDEDVEAVVEEVLAAAATA